MFYQTEESGRESPSKYPPAWPAPDADEYDPDEDDERELYSFLP